MSQASASPQHLAIVLPTWLGDLVMATPTLRALRAHYPQARITGLVKPAMQPIAAMLPGLDDVKTLGSPSRKHDYDLAVLLSNSFRSAWWCWRSRIPQRVGYARDGRALLLTQGITPEKQGRQFLPVPTVKYYLKIAAALGASIDSEKLSLELTEDAQQGAQMLLQKAGLSGRFVLFNPGAVRESKRWPAERFASLADWCHQQHMPVAVTGSPNERDVLDRLQQYATTPIYDLTKSGLSLSLLPAIVAQAAVLVTNDTGPRHIAAAVNTPLVTLFGPTPPEWTVIDVDHEIQHVAGGTASDEQPRASAKHEVAGRTMDLIELQDVAESVAKLWPVKEPNT